MNRAIRATLDSPLHGLLSARLMVLSYSGHRSGRRYRIPVGWFDWGQDEVLAFTRTLAWVPNMRGNLRVRLRIRGQEHDATPTVVEDRQEVADLLYAFVARKGVKAAHGLHLGLRADREPTPEEVARASSITRIVRFRLN